MKNYTQLVYHSSWDDKTFNVEVLTFHLESDSVRVTVREGQCDLKSFRFNVVENNNPEAVTTLKAEFAIPKSAFPDILISLSSLFTRIPNLPNWDGEMQLDQTPLKIKNVRT